MKKIEIEDITRYAVPGGLRYSPDGKILAFDVKRPDTEKNAYRTDVFIARGGAARQLTYSVSAGAVLWDDETHLILSREADPEKKGMTQLFRICVDGGEAEPWLDLPFPLAEMKKAGEGRYVASGLISEKEPDAYKLSAEERKKKAEEKKAEADYLVADETPFWFNGRGVTNGLRTALFLIELPAASGAASGASGETTCRAKIRRLTAPSFDTACFAVDGDMVYYSGHSRTRRVTLYDKVYAYDLAAGKRETLYGKSDHAFGELFVLGGRLYAHASDMKTYGVNETMNIYAVEKNALELVYVPPFSLYNSVIGDIAEASGRPCVVGDACYTLASVEDHTEIWKLTPGKDGSFLAKAVRTEAGMLCDLAVSGEKIAVVWQDWCHAPEVLEMEMDGADARQVTELGKDLLEGRYIAEPHRIDYRSEGEDLHGWVLLPENFDRRKKYPAVLDVHGGPRCIYGEIFFHEMQVWAARGFVVMFTNIRGSDGRGDAFADIRGEYGGVDFRNLMDFTDAVLAAYPNIDPARVCETGGSYGGFMTNWIITHTDRFCAAASQRSISNWISMSFIADIGLYFDPDQCGAKDCFDFEKQWDHSPLKYVKGAKTPTLFIHSDEDYRCPVDQGMQMMNALAAQNVETRIVIFHGENHELSRSGKPLHRVRRLREITDWFIAHTR